MQIFKGNQEQLKEKFDLNPLVIMWVGILRSKHIFLTEPVLELCKTDGPLETLFKDRTVVATLENQQEFDTFQRHHGSHENFPLTIIDQGSEKVIALQDEILAEEGWGNDKQDKQEVSSSKNTSLMTSPSMANSQGVEHLFKEEEIAQLKITIATAVSSSTKIEAVRKISLSQLDSKSKSLLFLHLLGDDDVVVRIEAAKALERNGFSSHISQATITICSGDDKQKQHAFTNLANLFEEASEFEKGTIIQVFMTTLKDRNYQKHIPPILSILIGMIPVLPANESIIERIMGNALDNLISDFENLQEYIFPLFEALKKLNQQQVGSFLWKELKKSKNRHLRTFILPLIADTETENFSEVIMMMIEEMGLGDELDPIYIRLTSSLKSFGEDVLSQIITRFRVSKRITEKLQLLQLINELLHEDTSKSIKNQIVEMFINSFATAHKLLRTLIMESKLLIDPDIEENLLLQMANETLLDLDTETIDQYPEAVRSCLCRMKKVSIAAILEILGNPASKQQSVFASSILGDVILALDKDMTQQIEQVRSFCLEQIESRPSHTEELYKVLGKLVTLPNIAPQMAQETVEYLLDNVCKASRPYAIIDAISWAASSVQIDQELKFDISYLLMTLFDKNLSGNFTKDHKFQGQKLYEIDVKTAAFTSLIPTIIIGLENLVVNPTTPSALQKKIITKLMARWRDISNYKIIWGPQNTLDLAKSLQKITLYSSLGIETKIEIIEALINKIEIFSIAELLVDIFAQDFGEGMAELAHAISARLMEFNKDKEFQNPEDKAVIMRCIGKMATAKILAVDPVKSEQNRERLIHVLFEGLREKVFRIQNILEDVLNSPNVSDRLKNETRKRLPD